MAEYSDDDAATKDLAPGSDEAILAEIDADYEYDLTNWTPIRDERAIDVRYAGNETWDKDDEKLREGRPMPNLDQLSQYRNQVENLVRQNKRGVKTSPAGGGATNETAELRANRIREIEYQSHAQEAYSQAYHDCLTGSYGFARIIAEYEDDEGRQQVFRTKSIPNPDQVLPDTDGQSTSGRDWKRCLFLTSMTHREFKRDYPHAKLRDFDAQTIANTSTRWLSATRVTVAEAWRVIETPNPSGKGRPKREVCMYLTNGLELLAKPGQPKKHAWKGKYIPFGACLGRVEYSTTPGGDTKKAIYSYIRFARDGAKGFNWAWATIFEKMALPIKAALLGYEGQVDTDTLALIQRSTKEHIAWIGFKPVLDATGQAVLPLPQYGVRAPDIQGDLLVAEASSRNIQNALGHFNAQDARLGASKVTSGTALQELKRAGDLGSFDFQDHYDDFLKFMGEQYDDLLTHYDDTPKEVATRLLDGEVKMVTINTPTGRGPKGDPVYKPTDARMDLGRHTVTISTGPSSDSQRDAGKDAAMALLQNAQAFPVIASDAVKLLDVGPIGDKMSEDLKFLQPPAMQQARQQADGKGPDPRQQQAEIGQLKQQLQHAEQVMQQQHGELEGKQAEIDSKERIADLQTRREAILAVKIQSMKDASALAVKKLDVLAKGIVSDNERELEQIAIDHNAAIETITLDHEREQAALDRQHQADQAAAAQQHQVGMAAAGAGAAADAQQAGHEQTLEQGQQAAELAPVPAGEE